MLNDLLNNVGDPLFAGLIGFVVFKYGLKNTTNDALTASAVVAGSSYVGVMINNQVRKMV